MSNIEYVHKPTNLKGICGNLSTVRNHSYYPIEQSISWLAYKKNDFNCNRGDVTIIL